MDVKKITEELTYREGIREVTLQLNGKGEVIRVVFDYLEPQPLALFMRTEAILMGPRPAPGPPQPQGPGAHRVYKPKPCGG
jgi:hypothetical protein